MAGVTYDTGALIAAERNDRSLWALHAGFLAEEVVPTVATTAQGTSPMMAFVSHAAISLPKTSPGPKPARGPEPCNGSTARAH